MPILHKLVAVCEGPCAVHQEYEAIVNHTGEAAFDSLDGSSKLTARDVEHEPELPDRWRYERSGSSWTRKLLCPQCQEKS